MIGTVAAAIREASTGATNCDCGTGLPGEVRQQCATGESASKVLVDPPGEVAIMGQWGLQCSESLELMLQQRDSAAAGPANSPTSNSKATIFDRVFTSGTGLIVGTQNRNRCDLRHTPP